MCFVLIYWTLYVVNTFFEGSLLDNVEKYGKPVVVPGHYGHFWVIPHRQLWPDWGL